MATYKVTDIKDKINLIGRSDYYGDAVIMDMTAAGIEFCADFSGNISFSYTAAPFGQRKIGLVLDNNYNIVYPVLLDEKAGSATFYAAVQKGIHTVRIVKMTEFNWGAMGITDITFDGEFCKRPERPKLKLEFYGDSLTCGYGNLSPNRNTPAYRPNEQDGLRTYCALTARYFNADMAVAAASGFGLTMSCDGNKNETYKVFAEKLSPVNNIDWNFDNYKADVVFINYGTNDAEYCRKNPDFVNPSDEIYSAVYDFVSTIRKHNPTCKLVFVNGVSGDMKYDGQIDVEPAYKRVFDELGDGIIINGLHCDQLGGDWHPSVSDHESIALRLEQQLIERLPQYFHKPNN